MLTRSCCRGAAAAAIINGPGVVVTTLGQRLTDTFGADRVGGDVPLAPLTTFKVGGPAEWLVTLHRPDDVCRAIAIARSAGAPVTALGGGSNVLVADEGLAGVVVRLHGGDLAAVTRCLIRV